MANKTSKKQVTSLVTTAKKSCGLRALFLEMNNNCNIGIRGQCSHGYVGMRVPAVASCHMGCLVTVSVCARTPHVVLFLHIMASRVAMCQICPYCCAPYHTAGRKLVRVVLQTSPFCTSLTKHSLLCSFIGSCLVNLLKGSLPLLQNNYKMCSARSNLLQTGAQWRSIVVLQHSSQFINIIVIITLYIPPYSNFDCISMKFVLC